MHVSTPLHRVSTATQKENAAGFLSSLREGRIFSIINKPKPKYNGNMCYHLALIGSFGPRDCTMTGQWCYSVKHLPINLTVNRGL